MSKRMFAMTLAIGLMVAPFAAAQTATSGAPKAAVVDAVKDFGTVPKGTKLDWSFGIKNNGTSDLEIIAVRPTCGCTVADFDKVIKSGQTGKITAHVDTTSFSGPISKAVMVETNDPLTPTTQLTITAIVKPYVEVSPAGFVRYNMLQGETATQAITVYSEEEEPLEIVKIESPKPWIKVSYVKAEGDAIVEGGRKGQNQYRVAFTVNSADAPDGMISERVIIVTNSKNQPEYPISITGIIRPTVIADPQAINFGEVFATDAAATRIVQLRSLTKTPEAFSVQKAESSVQGVTAKATPTEMPGVYVVTLQVAPTAAAGDFKGEVKIFTTDKLKPVITVPVAGKIKPAATVAK